MIVKKLTLAFLFETASNRILLGYKKRGFGQGRWNGFGGKVEKNESVLEGAQRELEEEAGIRLLDPSKRGLIRFQFLDDLTLPILEVHVYAGEHYEGSIEESEEMRPAWFSIPSIPYDKMWIDDKEWFPYLLSNKPFVASFTFQGEETIVSQKAVQCETVPDEWPFKDVMIDAVSRTQ